MSALNVTKAAFGGLREVTTSPLWQYDYGQILQITGLDLPQAFEVHFSNSRKSGETVTQIGTDSQVTIPDMFLTSGADIYCFIFLHDGLTDGETEYVIKIPVKERPEPSDIEPTPEQQDAITEAIAALNNAVNKADVAITHYPQVIEGVWHVWDVTTEAYVSTGVAAQGEKGDGGLSIFFDCASKPIPTDANRKIVENQTLTFGIYAFKGGEMIDPTSVTAATFICKSGQYNTAIQPTITHNASLQPQWRVSYSLNASANLTLNSDSGTQTVNVTVDGVVHKLYFPWSAAKQGIQGEGGLSILLTRQAIVLPTDNNRVPQSALTASVEVTAVKGTEIIGLDDVSGSSVNMEYIDGQGRRHGTFVMPTIEVTYDDIRDINVKYKLTYEFETSPYYFMADSGNITLTIEIDEVAYDRTIPWTLSKQGIQGGKGDVGTTPDLTIGTVQTLPEGSQATATITGTDEEPVLNLGLPKGDAGDDYVLTEQDKEEIADIVLESDELQSELNDKADIIISNAEGAIAIFEDGGNNMPMVSCVAKIEPVQDLHGYDSPWPAGGGKNKFRTTLTSQTKNGTTFTVNDDGSITVKGTPTEQTRVTMYSGVFWTANEVGVFSSGTMPTGTRIFCLRTRSGTATSYPTISPTATAQIGDEYSTMLLEVGTSYDGAQFTIYPQIELGSTATAWTPYSNICPISGWTGCNVVVSPTEDAQDGTTYPISWQSEAGTVYGGTVDVVSGVLTVDRGMQTLNGNETIGMGTTSNFRYFDFYYSAVDTNAWETNVISNFLKANISGASGCRVQYNADKKPRIVVSSNESVFADVDEVKAYLQITPLTIVYPLATPQTYQLSPVEVKTLLGLNNVWADTGDAEVEYRADTRLYIEKLTQPEEYDMIADSAITSGKFFMIGNTLYRALANIASGATITVGTNATKMSLSDALNALA